LGDQNRIRLEQPVAHLQLLWSRWAKKVLQITANFAAGMIVRVYGRLKGRDFMEQVFGKELANYNVQVRIKPEFPPQQVQRVRADTGIGLVPDAVPYRAARRDVPVVMVMRGGWKRCTPALQQQFKRQRHGVPRQSERHRPVLVRPPGPSR
jgi:hypothetical protein